MFKLKTDLTCWWPVKVKEPDPKKPGKFAEYQFEVEFRILARDEAQARSAARAAILEKTGDPKEILAELESFDDRAYHDTILDWRGIVDDADKALEFSPANLDEALRHNRIRAAINRAYEEAIGLEGGRLGN